VFVLCECMEAQTVFKATDKLRSKCMDLLHPDLIFVGFSLRNGPGPARLHVLSAGPMYGFIACCRVQSHPDGFDFLL